MSRFPIIRAARPPRLTSHTGVSTCRPKPPRRRAAGPILGRAGILLAIVLLATSCANGLTARRARLQPLVGQSLNTLIAIEGVPTRSFQANGVTYLSYVHQRIDLMAPVAPYGTPWIWGWYPELPPVAVVRGCETIFMVKGGVVQGFTWRGNACD